jgi:hypothetical protein
MKRAPNGARSKVETGFEGNLDGLLLLQPTRDAQVPSLTAEPKPAANVDPDARTEPQVSDVPAKAKPVSLRRKPHETEGSVEENHEWLPHLADGEGKHCRGKDPLTIPTSILSASGHPPRRTRDVVNAYSRGCGGEVFGLERIRRHKHLRRYCLQCLDGNAAEVRRCSTIHCPLWPYRLGHNPHESIPS